MRRGAVRAVIIPQKPDKAQFSPKTEKLSAILYKKTLEYFGKLWYNGGRS
jgi:hypothetical protein